MRYGARRKKMKELKIVTHNGIFHADEVMAVAIISLANGGAVNVTRTRDESAFKNASYVLDVGGIFDRKSGHFDHHQRDFAMSRQDGTPYATAGLIWHFDSIIADEVIDSIAVEAEGYLPSLHGKKIKESVDSSLMASIDAIDTGHRRPQPGEFHLSQAISGFNTPEIMSEAQDAAFMEAVGFAKVVLRNTILSAADAAVKESIVVEAIEKQEGEEVLVLPAFLPWQALLKPDSRGFRRVVWTDPSGQYRVQAVEVEDYLPENWRGLSGEELDAVTGVQGGVFVHAAGFIGGHSTFEGIMAMAKAKS